MFKTAFLSLVFWSLALFSSPSFAKDAVLTYGDLFMEETTLPPKKNIEVGLRGGYNVGNPYLDLGSVGGEVNYRFSRRWNVGLEYQKFFGRTSDLTVSVEENLNLSGIDRTFSVPESSAYLKVGWVPFIGHTNFMNQSLLDLDIFFEAGIGQMELESSSETAYMLAIGPRFRIDKWMGFSLFVKYESELSSSQTSFNQVGSSFFVAF